MNDKRLKVDPCRINLLERDIEDWLYDNPDVLYAPHGRNPITRWIGRQYELPSGIADLIGVREDGKVVVVELKNVPINKAAILQVCRYTDDVKYILSNRMEYKFQKDWNEPIVEMIVVGPSVDSQTFLEAQAVGVRIFHFETEVSVGMTAMGWNNDYQDKLHRQQEEIAARPEWDIFGITVAEDVKRLYGEARAPESYGPDEYSDIILS